MISALIYATLSPVFYALINVYDKYVVEHRAKKPLSYAVIDGSMIFLFAAVIAIFLDWSAVSLGSAIFPVICGILAGIGSWLYYLVIIKEDISHVVGIIYTYPIIVSMLSFLFLGEVIPFIGYVGMLISLTGIVLLSTRMKRMKLAIIIILACLILSISVGELLVKVSTNNMPAMNGAIIDCALMGLILAGGCFITKIRSGVAAEFRNIPVAFAGSVILYIAVIFLFLAMTGLPATIVASIAAIQPLLVLVFERITDTFLGKISKDVYLLPKLGAILLIVVGVVLIYAAA
jgi:uncharacterized membrane protein